MMSNTIIYSIKYNISRKEKRSNEKNKNKKTELAIFTVNFK